MKRTRWRALIAVLVVSVGIAGGHRRHRRCTVERGEKPKATDVGITATEIHIAVIADVDNPIVPEPVQGLEGRGRRASAKFLNSKAGGGGLAGRKVVVDFYDSKLNANATTNAEIQACENDVAAVGTSAVFAASVDKMRNCKDSTGAVTGLPDIPFVIDRAGAAVLRPVVPDGAAAGDLLHRRPAPADVPAERGPRLLLQQEVRQGPARRLRLRQRLEERP